VISGVGDALGVSRPEWRALAARLAAAHAFQRHGVQLARIVAGHGAPMESRMDMGSFHAATARVLAGHGGLPPTRQTLSFTTRP
jgi:hypothetical protein